MVVSDTRRCSTASRKGCVGREARRQRPVQGRARGAPRRGARPGLCGWGGHSSRPFEGFPGRGSPQLRADQRPEFLSGALTAEGSGFRLVGAGRVEAEPKAQIEPFESKLLSDVPGDAVAFLTFRGGDAFEQQMEELKRDGELRPGPRRARAHARLPHRQPARSLLARGRPLRPPRLAHSRGHASRRRTGRAGGPRAREHDARSSDEVASDPAVPGPARRKRESRSSASTWASFSSAPPASTTRSSSRSGRTPSRSCAATARGSATTKASRARKTQPACRTRARASCGSTSRTAFR